MKNLRKYIFGLAALAGMTMGLSSCQDSFDAPGVDIPEAAKKPTLTIMELKQMYWQDGVSNFADTIGLAYTEDGKPLFNADGSRMYDDKEYVIHGRVISSDEAGNVFKSLIIQDETAALPLSINSYNLYLKYRRGQEIVLDVKGMYIGMYNGYLQLGKPEWYAAGSAYEVSFMSPEFFESHVELNGLPQSGMIDTLVVNSFADIAANSDALMYWQARLVRFCNVEFQNGGTETYSTYHSSGVNQVLLDVDGTSWNVRTSGYSNFWNQTLPSGRGDLVAICGYYGSAWQLVLLDDRAWFSEATVAPGAEDNPYTVEEAVKLEQDGVVKEGVWVSGYIVGTVAPETETVTTNDDVEWSATPTLGNTLVVGATPDTKDIAQCLVISLPQGSDLRTYGALRENPDNYRKQIWLKGNLEKVMDTYGITGNTGSKNQFRIEGLELGGGSVPEGDGTAQKPYNATQATAKAIANGSSSTENVYVAGYVVSGSIDASYGSGKWYISDNPDGSGDTFYLYAIYDFGNKKFTDTNKVKVGDLVVCCGPIYNYTSSYGSTPEMSKGYLYSLNGATEGGGSTGGGDTPSTGTPAGDGTANKPYNATAAAELAKAAGADVKTEAVYVGGFVISGEISTQYMTGSWTIADNSDGSGGTFYVYACKDFGGEKFTDTSKVKKGDYIVIYGELVNFKGNTPEASYPTLISINGKGTDQGGSDPEAPLYKGDFDSFNGGTPKSSPYQTWTNATGWSLENGIVLGGQEEGKNNANPRFPFIGKPTTIAPTLDGKEANVGKLSSPVLTGGCGTLTFNYGFAFADTYCKFRIDILQGDTVVKSDTVTLDTISQYNVYNYTLDVNVTGDFKIVITNLSSDTSSNAHKDRVSIWNLTWTD